MHKGKESGSHVKMSPTFRVQRQAGIELLKEALADSEVRAACLVAKDALDIARQAEGLDEGKRLLEVAFSRCATAVRLLEERSPESLQCFGNQSLLWAIVSELFENDDLLSNARMERIPGYADRNPFVLMTNGDLDDLKNQLAPGQIWINATTLDVEQYRGLWGAVSFEQQAGLGREQKLVGRPLGSIVADRKEAARWLQAHPDAKERDVYVNCIASGLWADDGDFMEHLERNRQRVRRLKKLAKTVVD